MSQPNNRKESDSDPRKPKTPSVPIDATNPSTRFMRPNYDESETDDKTLNKKAKGETEGGNADTENPKAIDPQQTNTDASTAI